MSTYTEIGTELSIFKMMVEDMCDSQLISEILDMTPDESDIANIIYNHLQFRQDLTKLERSKLVWYYVLYNCEEYYNID